MIDIVSLASPIHQVKNIANRGYNIHGVEVLFALIDGAVAQDEAAPLAMYQPGTGDTALLDLSRTFPIHHQPGGKQDLPAFAVNNICRQLLTEKQAAHRKLFVDLIAAHLCKIITPVLKEQRVEKRAGVVKIEGFTGPQALVDLQEPTFHRIGMIFLQYGQDPLIALIEIEDLLVAAITDGPDQNRDRQLAGTIDTDEDAVIDIGLEFQPGPAVGNDRGAHQLFAGTGVGIFLEINSRRANQLADDNPFGPVDNESTVIGHLGKIAHEHFLFFYLTRLPVDQAHLHFQRNRVRGIPLLTLVHRIFWFAQSKV